jgi:predicted nucleic acid-binding protein
MTAARPLVAFDTNILVDIWLGRDGDQAVLLLELAEEERIELVIPEYALIEFRGTAMRWLRDERDRLNRQVRSANNEWLRCKPLGDGADLIRSGAARVEQRLGELQDKVAGVDERIRRVARVERHTIDVHFRGDLRYLSGAPPDRPVDGLKDCRIYEAVLDIARADEPNAREKYVVTKDSDFEHAELVAQLGGLRFTLRRDPGKLYGEIRKSA